MAIVVGLTFNVFQENTYLVYDASGECVIFDPGCSNLAEKQQLVSTISRLQLRPVRLINTHAHIDHILGNRFVADTYGLELEIHADEVNMLRQASQVAAFYGIEYPEVSPEPGRFITSGDLITFGETSLEARYTPGHSPASLSFYCPDSGFVIAGDVLFRDSIGRTDLPGGNEALLLKSIREQLFILPDEVVVYPGHGPKTTIGYERQHNPFF
ncbi:MAG: MBL fold metallo-hydrolase [Lewinellaceae bacterium]|nr:MBL fold metallo-hydrolase [Lewinellaceae bacterium]